MAKKKLVILVAPTGGNAVDREGAHVPTTPDEIAEEALRCREAGASVLHIHARDPATKAATSDFIGVQRDNYEGSEDLRHPHPDDNRYGLETGCQR